MKKRVIIYLGILLGTIFFCSGCGLFSKKVEFEDPLVERCVRMTLGKEAEETIREKDCAKIEELLIDCDLDIGLTEDYYLLQGVASANYIDLCDLQYFTGLRTLVIDNKPSRDLLVNIDAIGNCTKLEELTMIYNPAEYNYFGMAPMGYKYLAEIISRLPKLEYLSLGYEIAEEHRELLAGDNDDLEFEDDFNGVTYLRVMELTRSNVVSKQDINEYEDAWKYEKNESDFKVGAQGNVAMVIEDEAQLEEFLNGLSDDTEDICIFYQGTDEIDMELFAEFSKLKTLSVINDVKVTDRIEEADIEVIHLNALAENKQLFSLNLSNVIFEEEELKEITGLKELSLNKCKFDEADFLECMPRLRELTVLGNRSEELADYLEDNGDKMSSLKFLRVHCDEQSNYKGIEKYENLEALSILTRGRATSFKYIVQCPKLKYLSVEVEEEKKLDIEDLTQAQGLEYVFVSSTRPILEITGMEEVVSMPNMKSLVLMVPMHKEADEANYDAFNDAVKAAKNSETLSCFIHYGMFFPDRLTMENGQNVHEVLDLEKLYRADIICGGYDRLLIANPEKYGSLKEITEAFQ